MMITTKYLNVIGMVVSFAVIILARDAIAADMSSQRVVEKAVTNFVKQQNVPLKNIQIKITSLNKQLHIPACHTPLKVDMSAGTRLMGRTSLSISCMKPEPWKIHLAVHIDGETRVVVAAHPIARGDVINKHDLKITSRRYSQLRRGYYHAINKVTEMEARRNIKAGQVLSSGMVKPQKLVERGQHVTIIAKRGNLKLRLKGKAMMDGRKGQTIRVTNLSSKKLIFAKVISAGVVKVNI